jgi:hypothetical protein
VERPLPGREAVIGQAGLDVAEAPKPGIFTAAVTTFGAPLREHRGAGEA